MSEHTPIENTPVIDNDLSICILNIELGIRNNAIQKAIFKHIPNCRYTSCNELQTQSVQPDITYTEVITHTNGHAIKQIDNIYEKYNPQQVCILLKQLSIKQLIRQFMKYLGIMQRNTAQYSNDENVKYLEKLIDR